MSPNFEEPQKIYRESQRERVDKLRASDGHDEDSVQELAMEEDDFRKDLKDARVPKKRAGFLADKYSDAKLEAIEAKRESSTDALTGLGNRRALEETALKLLSLEKRKGENCAMLMVDADFFKKINDAYGHPAGDQVLKELANRMKKAVRESDYIFRIGGEEFAVFLLGIDLSDAKKMAEKIQETVKNPAIKIIDNDGKKQDLSVTLSIGCASGDQTEKWNDHSVDTKKTLAEMLKKADAALYFSKSHGRNQTTIFNPEMFKA